MSSGLIICPCCGQILYVSYNDLIGFTASQLIFNNEELQKQIYNQTNCNLRDRTLWQQEQIRAAQNCVRENTKTIF